MTLPYPNKPAATDIISTIVSNTKDNLDQIDSSTKYKAISFTRDLSAAVGDVAYTGVGFNPRTIIFFADEPTSDAFSWGIYCSSNDGYTGRHAYQSYTGVHANGYAGYVATLWVGSGLASFAYVTTTGSDGFTLNWANYLLAPTGTATIKAFCIR
jgi:hypothetical protein